MTTVAVISTSMISVINPTKLINKANDAKREKELYKTKIALEEYYNDHDHYPSTIELSSLFENDSYKYVNDGSENPKWYVIFNDVKSYTATVNSCNLRSSCLPKNYKPYWDCTVSDNYKCDVVALAELPITSRASISSISKSSSVGVTSPTASPTNVSIAPTIPSNYDMLGSDGTWCNDSDDGSYYVKNAYCQDTDGTHLDYCDINTAKEYYCSGTWSGNSYSNVHCALGGYVCQINQMCQSGACVIGTGATSITPTSSIGVSVTPTNIMIGSSPTPTVIMVGTSITPTISIGVSVTPTAFKIGTTTVHIASP